LLGRKYRRLGQNVFDVGGRAGILDLAGWNLLAQLDDVIAVGGGDDVTDLVGLQREGRGFDLRHHLAAREFVFAASVLGDRVFGEFAGQLGEVIPGTRDA
jgi:hypothetical protein